MFKMITLACAATLVFAIANPLTAQDLSQQDNEPLTAKDFLEPLLSANLPERPADQAELLEALKDLIMRLEQRQKDLQQENGTPCPLANRPMVDLSSVQEVAPPVPGTVDEPNLTTNLDESQASLVSTGETSVDESLPTRSDDELTSSLVDTDPAADPDTQEVASLESVSVDPELLQEKLSAVLALQDELLELAARLEAVANQLEALK